MTSQLSAEANEGGIFNSPGLVDHITAEKTIYSLPHLNLKLEKLAHGDRSKYEKVLNATNMLRRDRSRAVALSRSPPLFLTSERLQISISFSTVSKPNYELVKLF